jgi:hypothetical protein
MSRAPKTRARDLTGPLCPVRPQKGPPRISKGTGPAIFGATVRNAGGLVPDDRIWGLWGMLESYFPIYQLARDLQALRTEAKSWRGSNAKDIYKSDANDFQVLLKSLHQKCSDYGFTHTSDLAKRLIDRDPPVSYAVMVSALDHLNDSLSYELEKEAVFRIPPERKTYFERDDLFGPEVATAFPSCRRDIEKAGSCYALGQEDACVHHLMLVLERGLKALAARVGVSPYDQSSWQTVITNVEIKTKTLPNGPDLYFYREVNAQFGFLKVAYRNHSEHAHDDLYDMPKALHILNQVKEFMRMLEKGRLSE